jgi:hypothetical protein
VAVMLLVVLIAVGNFALGFGLAMHLGYGPAWAKWPTAAAARHWLRTVLRRSKADVVAE